ncbi:Uncharacterized protein HSRCO_0251 [Halanaeroarchaeum sp. HSR-CO]|uniref:DUF5812 family protein n=1 Tax=Halanaeroarchaeum sp. HSR-CO TaxID=2866382 RepID=UPI00217E66BA|nr:DUF5812 family protein [Halanaeroarchaeum sp. HSR-CO]UWG46551.1 Uncharacterized protein HSRCO_0251 [Halanaeroarchaeum sp. HSR-CO]
MPSKSGTFLVTAADADSVVLADVTDSQVHTLGENPGLSVDEVVDATIAPVPPMEAVWTVEDLRETRSIAVEVSDERPTKTSRDLAATMDEGDLETRERAGTGAIHVITVPTDLTDAAVDDVREDESTLRMAARLGVDRVEIRASPGVVTVRYLP